MLFYAGNCVFQFFLLAAGGVRIFLIMQNTGSKTDRESLKSTGKALPFFYKFSDNKDMADSTNFSKELIEAVAEKTVWYDSTELPKVLNSYRNIKGYTNNLVSVLSRKGLIQDDPYKLEKKIADIKPIENTQFMDNERAAVLGVRLSDYDNMLEYICSYVKFSVESLTLDRIKKLNAFNKSLPWGTSSTTSEPTLKSLFDVIHSVKAGSDNMSITMINDIMSLLAKELSSINQTLKGLLDFQREVYKASVRKNVLDDASFDAGKAAESPQAALAMIRKVFAAKMNKQPFYAELVQEIINEEYGANKEAARKRLLEKLAISETSSAKKEESINYHETIMEAVRILGSCSSQLEMVAKKLTENKDTLESQNNSFFNRIKKALRKAFGLAEKPIEYRVTVTENVTHSTRIETVLIQDFITDIEKRAKVYSSISVRKNPGYQKLDALNDMKVLEFLNKQLSECQKILILLGALDSYFKTNANASTGLRIKGIKIEISSLKGILHNANQQRAEFVASVEEKSQLRNLGITNAK